MNKNEKLNNEEARKKHRKGLFIAGIGAAAVVATAIAVPLALSYNKDETHGDGFVPFNHSNLKGADNAHEQLAEKTFGKEAARKIVENNKEIKSIVGRVIQEQLVEKAKAGSVFVEPPKTADGMPLIDPDNVEMHVKDVSVKMFVPLPAEPDKERYDIKYMVDIQHKDADETTGTLHITTDQDHAVHEVMFVPRAESKVPPVTITKEADPTIISEINAETETAVNDLHEKKWKDTINEVVTNMVQKITASDFDSDLDASEKLRSYYVRSIIAITKDQKPYDDGNGATETTSVDKDIADQSAFDDMRLRLSNLDKEMQAKIDAMKKKVIAHDFKATIDFGGGDVRTVVDDDMQYREYLRDYYLKHLKLGAVSMETSNALMLLKAMNQFPEFDYDAQKLGVIDLPESISASKATDNKDNFDARRVEIEKQIREDVLAKERAEQDKIYAGDSNYEKRYILPVNGEVLTFATKQEADDFYESKFGPDSYSLEILGTGEILSIPSNIENLDPKTIVTQLAKPLYESRTAKATSTNPNPTKHSVPETYTDIYEIGWDKDKSKADFTRIRDTLVSYMKDRFELLKDPTATLSTGDGATQADVNVMKMVIDDKLTDDALKAQIGSATPGGPFYESLIGKAITPLFMNAMKVFKEEKAIIKIQLAKGPHGKPIYLRDSEGEIVKLSSSSDLPIAKVIKGADSALDGEKNISYIYVKKQSNDVYQKVYEALKATKAPLAELLTTYLSEGIIPLEYTHPDKDYTMQYSEEGKMLLFPMAAFSVLGYPVNFQDKDNYDPRKIHFFNVDGSIQKDSGKNGNPAKPAITPEKMFEDLDNFIFEESFTSWMGEIEGKISTLLETPDKSNTVPLDVIYKEPSEHKFTIDYMDNPYEYDGVFYKTQLEAMKAQAAASKII